MARKYNFIYCELVQSESDMIGHIAYSIYKAEKISWIERHKSENEGKEPTESEFEEYNKSCCSTVRIANYRSMASSILQDFMGSSADMMAGQVAKEVSENVTKHINENIAPQMPKKTSKWAFYGHGIAQSAIGTIALSLVIGIVLFVCKHSVNELWKALAEFFNSLSQQS